MINLYQKTWTEINNDIAQKIVRLRKRKKITQKQLAARSGVENELEGLFDNVPFASIEEIINEQTK